MFLPGYSILTTDRNYDMLYSNAYNKVTVYVNSYTWAIFLLVLTSVIWVRYCRYGVKHKIINRSISVMYFCIWKGLEGGGAVHGINMAHFWLEIQNLTCSSNVKLRPFCPSPQCKDSCWEWQLCWAIVGVLVQFWNTRRKQQYIRVYSHLVLHNH